MSLTFVSAETAMIGAAKTFAAPDVVRYWACAYRDARKRSEHCVTGCPSLGSSLEAFSRYPTRVALRHRTFMRPRYQKRSAFPFTSRYWLLHGSPRPCCPVFPLVSFPFLASGYLCLVPHLHDPGSFSSPYACVSLQLLSRSPLRYLQIVRFIRRGLCVHRRSSLSPISFRISVLPPRFRGSVFLARESRRSAR
jgi:hypothetical protein